MNVDHSVRWRATIIAGAAGRPTVLRDDWCLSTSDGEILARVFKSKAATDQYLGAVCVGRASVSAHIHASGLPTRRSAMQACENRLATIVKLLDDK